MVRRAATAPSSPHGRCAVTKPSRKTVALKRLTRAEMRVGAFLYPERAYWRPAQRIDCGRVPRPCPYVGCRHHLYLDVNATNGSIKTNFPELEVWKLGDTCSLDLAAEGGLDLDRVAELLNLSAERVGQIEAIALVALRSRVLHL